MNVPDEKLPTQFAPAERLSDDLLAEQVNKIHAIPHIPTLLNLIPYIVVILNRERQVIYSNNALYEILDIGTAATIGFRPGEVLKCIHAETSPGGCGTTEHCGTCGAIQAILESQRNKSMVSKECRLTFKQAAGIGAMDLLVFAAPVGHLDAGYTLFMVKDIAAEKRKQVFEKVFFHDLLNTSGAVKGLIELIKTSDELSEAKQLCDFACEGMEMLMEEIISQKELVVAESGELVLKISEFSAQELLTRLVNQYAADIRTTCQIRIHPCGDSSIRSDIVLVRRVVNNMLKNAVEASGSGDTVWIEFAVRDAVSEFRVRNSQYIPREAQLQIFQRSFSSKGSGRGIGTYSMKLFGEKYLGGRIEFTTDPLKGTEFIFRLPAVAAANLN